MLKRIFGIASLLFTMQAFSAETVFQTIGPINFNGDANIAFFRGANVWGVPGCPNATYVAVKAEVSGRKEILSLALAAKMAGKRVQFWGTCDADTNYFNAMYIIVE